MIQLVCIGKMKASPAYAGLDALCQTYLKRVQPWWTTQLLELPESRTTTQELAALTPYLKKAQQVLLWTEHGQTWTSPAWSHWLIEQRDAAGFSEANPWLWIIAGPQGPDPGLVSQCRQKASLSAMTFPHLVARMLVLEQLYRGLAMANGVNYHK
jgi:23S rRNA (pseudouridine1915-N3)-methyltransferase